MDDKTPQGKTNDTVNPIIAEQLEQIKKSVPDTSQRLYDFLTANLKSIGIACLVLLIGVACWEGVSQWRARNAAKAADVLGVILIEKTDAKARVQALEAFLKDAPSSLKPTVELELAAAAMIDKQYDKAATAWASLEDSSSPDLKVVAGIGHAKSLMLQDKAQDALTLLQTLKTKSPEAYSAAITRQIAVAAEQTGNAQVAGAAYAELVAKGDDAAAKPYYEFKANQLKPKS